MLQQEKIRQAIKEFCRIYPQSAVVLSGMPGRETLCLGNPSLLAAGAAESPDVCQTKIRLGLSPGESGMLRLYEAFPAGRQDLAYSFRLLAENLKGILAQCHLQADLVQQRRYQDAIAESVSDGLLLVDRSGRLDFINSIGARILGVSRDWAIGRHLGELVDFRPVVLDVIETGIGYTDKEFVLKGKTKTFHFMKTAVPIRDQQGQVVCVVDTFREIRRVQKMVTSMTGLSARFTFDDIVGESAVMRECIRMASIAAQSISNVLIQGESGTGKELLAQAIHNAGSLADGPFVAVNCAAIPRELVESELFGYEDGAFTGAVKGGRPGKFELAHEGTIFLDEIGDMPLDMQVKLLRVIQDRKVMRIGGSNVFQFNGRIIAASNRDLLKETEEGSFRRDLFYRLNVLTVHSPPLRERKEDIPPTVAHILRRVSGKPGAAAPVVGREALAALEAYDWPGNVRELENALERAINVAARNVIQLGDLPKHIVASQSSGTVRPGKPRSLDEAEAEAIKEALTSLDRNISRAAHVLGVTRNTLYSKIRKYGLDCSNFTQ